MTQGLATAGTAWHPAAMQSVPNTTGPVDEAAGDPQTGGERARRLAYEAELVARGRADVAAGRVVSGEDAGAWVGESVRLGRPGERPRPGRRAAPGAG